MAAFSETYVNPSIAADSGTGTIGDPYGDLQYALNTMTRDGTNGDRVNVKSGTSEILAADLVLTTYGSPTGAAPLCIQGYTSAAGDGGKGVIDCNGAYELINSVSRDHIIFRDLRVHNGGSDPLLDANDFISVINCDFDDCNGSAIFVRDYADIRGCTFTLVDDVCISVNSGFVGYNTCYDQASGVKMNVGISMTQLNRVMVCVQNVIYMNGESPSAGVQGIRIEGRTSGEDHHCLCAHNSLFGTTDTTSGIQILKDLSAVVAGGVFNNLIEGFGTGLNMADATTRNVTTVAGNSVFGSTTDFSLGELAHVDFLNESLAESPFAKSGTPDHAGRLTWFRPKDVGDVLSPWSAHLAARGAIQRGIITGSAQQYRCLHPIESGLA